MNTKELNQNILSNMTLEDLKVNDVFIATYKYSSDVVNELLCKVIRLERDKIILDDLKVLSAIGMGSSTDLGSYQDFEYDISYDDKDFEVVDFVMNLPSDMEIIEKLRPEIFI